MLALHGNTAPYLQYAHARVQSIFRKAGPDARPGPVRIAEPAEHALALDLLGFAGLVPHLAESLELHRLAGYLSGLAAAFMTFFEQCPVLTASDPVRSGRLTLCDLTGRTLRTGLGLLGIAAPDRM